MECKGESLLFIRPRLPSPYHFSVLQSLVDGGLLSEQTDGEDKVLQIEMDLPGYPGLVIQVIYWLYHVLKQNLST